MPPAARTTAAGKKACSRVLVYAVGNLGDWRIVERRVARDSMIAGSTRYERPSQRTGLVAAMVEGAEADGRRLPFGVAVAPPGGDGPDH